MKIEDYGVMSFHLHINCVIPERLEYVENYPIPKIFFQSISFHLQNFMLEAAQCGTSLKQQEQFELDFGK